MNLSEQLKTYRLSKVEYDLMVTQLGREPRGVEWALFSALWSEHCSYKSSKVHLRRFFNSNERVLDIQGENAGVVDLGEGERIAFKMESHNHPSFIEPFQGAATGVGGILRDIFTMGARPIANADFLCFGDIQADRMKSLVRGVVKGIGTYGNCVGVPTVTGQTEFDSGYNGNILVNAMSVGLFSPGDPMCLSGAKGDGYDVVYVGAKTGRDGIHGASMASESFDEDSESKRPTIQIGDPFYEKLLIESCLEVMKQGLVVAIQDMGAAGLTSSSFEMAAKGKVGLEMHLDKVPLRDPSMQPEDILLSESQERMLLVCRPEDFKALSSVFLRWGLDAVRIGKVLGSDDKRIHLYWHGEDICAIDPKILVDEAPVYRRPLAERNTIKQEPASKGAVLQQDSIERISTSLNFSSKEWIYRQYDQRVGVRTAWDASYPIGALNLPDSGRGLGIVTGCRPYLMRRGAFFGAYDSVFYPALKLACYGFEPLALTDCLNFGNPERPETMRDFSDSVDAISEACRVLNAPVISGNVSFYNETNGVNIPPTPATGMVGLRKNVTDLPSSVFTQENEPIYLIKMKGAVELAGRFADLRSEKEAFNDGFVLEEVSQFIKEIRELSLAKMFTSVQPVGDFGVFRTLIKMSGSKSIGAKIDIPVLETEVFYAVLATGAKLETVKSPHFTVAKVGMTQKEVLELNGYRLSVADVLKSYQTSLGANL